MVSWFCFMAYVFFDIISLHISEPVFFLQPIRLQYVLSCFPAVFILAFSVCSSIITLAVLFHLQTLKENADGVIFFFSMTDRSSFDDIPQQMSKILGEQSSNMSKLVIATK